MRYVLFIIMILAMGCGKQEEGVTIIANQDCKNDRCKPKNIRINAPGVNINIENKN